MAGGSMCIHCLQPGAVEPTRLELERLRRVSHPIRGNLHVILHGVDEIARCGTRRPDGRCRWPWSGLSDVVAAQGIRRGVESRDSGTHAPVSVCRRRDSAIAPSGSLVRLAVGVSLSAVVAAVATVPALVRRTL